MAAEGNIVDELVVQLTLDAEPYQEAERKVNREADRTARQQTERARQTERRDRDQQKRLKDVGNDVRGFMRSVAGAATVVAGLGAAFGASLVNLLGFETGLRRQTVGTALSNREMQAWGATARRLGADAQAGADAIAAFARERQQAEFGMPAPTMQALSQFGVNTNKDIPIQDVIGQAQRIYRAQSAPQQQQMENVLSARGVSADLILMIKSERDAREVFAQSFAQASEENRKALDQLADSLESMKAQAIAITSTLLTAFQPALEVGAQKLSDFAVNVASFAEDVTEAGGGVDGFKAALDRNVPMLGRLFEGFQLEGKLLSEAVSVFTSDFRRAAAEIAGIWERVTGLLNRVRAPWGSKGIVDDLAERARKVVGVKDGLSWTQNAAVRLSDAWGGRVESANKSTTTNPYGLPANIEENAPASTRVTPRSGEERTPATRAPVTPQNPSGLPQNIEENAPASARVTPRNPHGLPQNIEENAPLAARPRQARTDDNLATSQGLMSKLIVQYDMSVQDAAAIVANWDSESSLRPTAYNDKGGGTGARGLAQWRGPRSQAFKQRYGIMPDQGTIDQQIEFMMTDPYERNLLNKSLAPGGTAAEKGRRFSERYEAHMDTNEDVRRGTKAQLFADEYARSNPTNVYSIQNLNLQANRPEEMASGLQRLSGTQNYNSVQR